MKWGLGQSPKRVDNQSVAIDKIFTSNSCCFVKCNHSFKVSFEKTLGEVKVNLGPEIPSGYYVIGSSWSGA
ncbi:hypothetical protein D1164_13610 [Mariniphaga sediminis]|uniref:Uncharacterized protein n=1 Tax=Mariniphaga sediminis TaxID=1628158 RepID=A0A399D1W2_9BACT|nr:hypothetical protein [Mariniphaga sediminis]RIH64672.1 hypothetical protein D1164_13610 [Mariniphaga sediminis]